MIYRSLLVSAALLVAVTQAGGAPVVVKSGDTLSSIAQQYLGDPARWPEICEANAEVLNGDCDSVAAGATIEVPDTTPIVEAPAAIVAAEPVADASAAEPVIDAETVDTEPLAETTGSEPAVVQDDNVSASAESTPAGGATVAADAVNLLKSPDDLSDPVWLQINGLSVVDNGDGSFTLVTDGTADPILFQTLAGDPAGRSYQYSFEAKAGESAGLTPTMRTYAYAATAGLPLAQTIQSKNHVLTDQFAPYSFDVSVAAEDAGQLGLVFRFDPGDAVVSSDGTVPAGYSVTVRNLRAVALP